MIGRINSSTASLIYESTQPKQRKVENKNISRVDEIKEAIKNGTYKIDIEKTSKAMAKSLL